MKTKSIALSILFTCLCIAGCKKDKETVQQSAKQKIEGKWNFISLVEETTTPPQPTKTVTHDGKKGYYFDFRADGTVKTNLEGDDETPYTINNNMVLTMWGQDYNIVEFTDNKLVFNVSSTSKGTTYKLTYTLNR